MLPLVPCRNNNWTSIGSIRPFWLFFPFRYCAVTLVFTVCLWTLVTKFGFKSKLGRRISSLWKVFLIDPSTCLFCFVWFDDIRPDTFCDNDKNKHNISNHIFLYFYFQRVITLLYLQTATSGVERSESRIWNSEPDVGNSHGSGRSAERRSRPLKCGREVTKINCKRTN